jgi:hypothetical protein
MATAESKHSMLKARVEAEYRRRTPVLLHLSLLNRGIFTSSRGFICLSTPMEKTEVDDAVRTFTEALADIH